MTVAAVPGGGPSASPANAAHFIRGFARIDVTEAAQRVACPTLVVHVRGDLMPPLREGRLLASLVPGGRCVSLEGDNHILLEDEPAWGQFLAEMDRFLAELFPDPLRPEIGTERDVRRRRCGPAGQAGSRGVRGEVRLGLVDVDHTAQAVRALRAAR